MRFGINLTSECNTTVFNTDPFLNNVSEVMPALTGNKSHDTLTMLCVESVYVEVNMHVNAVILPCHLRLSTGQK